MEDPHSSRTASTDHAHPLTYSCVSILDCSLAREPIATHPPLAVFEVLSPEDTIRRMRVKLADYHGKGIPSIFLVDPETGAFEQYRNGQLVIETIFHQPERGISLSLSEIAKLVS